MVSTRIRTLALLAAVSLSTIQQGCGSKDDGNSSGGDNNNDSNAPDLTRPNDPASCNRAWGHFVANYPTGMKLTYETSAPGYQTTYSSEIIESNNDRVTTRTTLQGEVTENSTTRDEFVATCLEGADGGDGTGSTDPGYVIEERRKEKKTVRAGTFSTNYIRVRHDRVAGQDDSSMVTEVWMANGDHGFMVYQHNINNFGGNTYESTTELVEIRRP
jgi:hypothetical protein